MYHRGEEVNKQFEQSQIEGLFEKIKVCLESISTVPLAAACAADLTQRMATSPEHFYAADLHMRQCEKWKNIDDDPAGTFCSSAHPCQL